MTQKYKFLFVAKDMGGANVTIPMAKVARDEVGDEVGFITEGLATERVRKAGFEPAFAGTKDFRDEPFEFDAAAFLAEHKPDYVVVGQGHPINLEERITLAANERRIPVISVTDFWGGASRIAAKLDAIICLDGYDQSLALRSHPEARKMVIAGNPGVPTSEERGRIIAESKALDSLRAVYSDIIVYVGGAPDRTTRDLELVVSSLLLTRGRGKPGLIFRPHPKHANRLNGEGRRYGDIWREMFTMLGGQYIGECSELATDKVVASADVVVSDYSTLITTAAALEKRTVSLVTEASMKSLTSGSNSKVIPQVYLGLSFPLSEPMDLSKVTYPNPEVVRRLKPFDAKTAFLLF
ncbi:MAG: hypothetical protein Q7S15_00470 [bacterium]|nr:hypothetical protein [bacterium]